MMTKFMQIRVVYNRIFLVFNFFVSLFVANKSKFSFCGLNIPKRQKEIQDNPNITWTTKLNDCFWQRKSDFQSLQHSKHEMKFYKIFIILLFSQIKIKTACLEHQPFLQLVFNMSIVFISLKIPISCNSEIFVNC